MLSQKERLNKSAFAVVSRRGLGLNFPLLSIKVLRGREEGRRFSVVIPKAVAALATSRNRLRRRTYGIIRSFASELSPSASIIIFFKKGVERLSFPALRSLIREAFVAGRVLRG